MSEDSDEEFENHLPPSADKKPFIDAVLVDTENLPERSLRAVEATIADILSMAKDDGVVAMQSVPALCAYLMLKHEMAKEERVKVEMPMMIGALKNIMKPAAPPKPRPAPKKKASGKKR